MKPDISKIDKNFLTKDSERADAVFYDVHSEPFELFGFADEKNFNRLPEAVINALPESDATRESIKNLAEMSAGGRVRFKTDSEFIIVKSKMPYINMMPHMPISGYAGFDVYFDCGGREVFRCGLTPPADMSDGYVRELSGLTREMREVTINFPLYNPVSEVYIGLAKGARLERHRPYKYEKPVVYYGSSITQGGCASRPGNAYEAMISQSLDCNHINLGFSGRCRAEEPIMEYIAGLSMSVFVYDYDYNAPSIEHLINTHERGFKIVREKNPELPVIFVSAPPNAKGNADYEDAKNDVMKTRRNIIFNTYKNACDAGDKNVYFIDGAALFAGEFCDSCTVDGCHPNDLGFARMARNIGNIVAKVIK